MAPEQAILKRKRSRPSEWWAVAPTSNATETPQQHNGRPPKKRGQTSNFGAERIIQEAPTAANRGKSRQSITQEGTGNMEGRGAKPLRSRRSSNTEVEVMAAAKWGNGKDGGSVKNSARPSVTQVEEDKLVNEPGEKEGAFRNRHGQPADATERDELSGEPADAAAILEKHGRLNAAQIEDPGNQEPAAEAPRKKRGRPWSISRARVVAAGPLSEEEAAVLQSLRRGQSSNTQAELQDVLKMSMKPQPKGGKNGQGAMAEGEFHVDAEKQVARTNRDDAPAKPLRRGRSSNTEAEVQALIGSSTKQRFSQKKRAKTANVETEAPVDVVAATKVVVKKKHSRQTNTKIVEPTGAMSSAQEEAQSKMRKRQKGAQIATTESAKDLDGGTARGRRSDTIVEIETATSSLARDRNVPKKRDNQSKAADDKTQPSKSKRRNHQSNAEIQESKESHPRGEKPKRPTSDVQRNRREMAEMAEAPPEPKRRLVERESEHEPASQRENPPTYQHLAPVTHRVSCQTIETKWEPLPPACVEQISQMVHDLQRPVIVHINDDRKRTEANTALHMICRRLISKVSKGLPFPPPMRRGREDDFDFEKILDYNSALEAQLTPALHANELLEAELAKETGQLESDQAALAKLETNAKTEATVRKDAGRKLHSLLRSDLMITEVDFNDQLGLGGVLQSVLPFSHTEDDDLQEIANELKDHLDTIQGNISRVQGISKAITKSRAAVQATLFDHLDTNDYEDIVVG